MLDVLHVEWVRQPACDHIEAERKDPMHDDAVAFTVAGSKKAYMDSDATEDMEYTYRLRSNKDTVILPQRSTVRIVTRFDEPGMWMVHCHILEHTERGMMAEIHVEP
ncbi:multicopper oxidase domain-containing protein [Sorangium sp. So ce426]|uniref:multicopper oxidase domain-containing protein n=1 Tax=Sorangium sp. So ce426 TaxID=3133312 RepID=UPI003F5C8837